MDSQELRIYIGNISPKLAESPATLSSRLEKFGDVVVPLKLHTKPVQSHFFGFVTMNISLKNFQQLKKSLHNVVFMGMKLFVSVAKQPYQWQPESAEEQNNDRVQLERSKRITEYKVNHHINPFTSESTVMHVSTGYSVSPHTFNDLSGNTKNVPPSSTLVGSKSYGALTNASKFYNQRHAMTSGGGEVVRGRIRKTPRTATNIKQQTLRVLVNGELKKFKFYKTKLWGIEKNKTVSDLTWKYSNGAWKSGDDHVIEKVQTKHAVIKDPTKCALSGEDAQNYGKQVVNEDADEEEQEDKTKSLAVLSSMFASYDFDKPVELEVDNEEEVVVDSKGRKRAVRYDYEMETDRQGTALFDATNYNPDLIETYKETAEKPAEEVYYSESDEGNELDFDVLNFSTEKMKNHWDDEHQDEDNEQLPQKDEDGEKEDESEKEEKEEQEEEEEEEEEEKDEESDDEEQEEEEEDVGNKSNANEDSEIEEEFMPTFGQSAPVETNNTDTLRQLFNPQKPEGFSLVADDDDIDESKTLESEKIVPTITEDDTPIENTNFGLFWLHEESPFLQTQTQLSKMGYSNDKVKLPGEDQPQQNDRDESPYEAWFWKMRGEVTRECKRRRRDALRTKSKSSKLTI